MSPTTWKRKCPDSITPAWIGPTATWYASSPCTGTVQRLEVEVVRRRAAAVARDRRSATPCRSAPRARPTRPRARGRRSSGRVRRPRRPSRAAALPSAATRTARTTFAVPRSRPAKRQPSSSAAATAIAVRHRIPWTSARAMALPGSHSARGGEPEQAGRRRRSSSSDDATQSRSRSVARGRLACDRRRSARARGPGSRARVAPRRQPQSTAARRRSRRRR